MDSEINREKRSRAISQPNLQHITKLFVGKKYDECLKVIEVALPSIDDATHLKILQAGCWTHMNTNHDAAVQQLSDVIQAEPNNCFAYYGLGLNFYLRGELDKCLDPFTRASEINQTAMNRASVYKDSALKVLKLLGDAKMEMSTGRCTKALEILSLAVLVDPENAAIKRIVKQQTDMLLQKVVEGLEDDVLADDDIKTILNHVNFLVKVEKFEDADKMVPNDELLSNARGWFLKGFVKYMLGSIKLSLVYSKKALEMDETMQEAKDLAEKANKLVELIDGASEHMKLNENNKAVTMLTKALEVDVNNKRIVQAIYFQRAVANFNLGKPKEAFEDYLLFEGLQNLTGMIMGGIKF